MSRFLAGCVLLVAVLAPIAPAAATRGAPLNWSLLLVTAGPHGASNVIVRDEVRGEAGPEPLVIGVIDAEQRGHEPHFVSGFTVQTSGGPDQINVAGPLGHHQITLHSSGRDRTVLGSSGQFGNFAPREQLAELFIYAGGTITQSHLAAAASSGSVTARRIFGADAQALYVADSHDTGTATSADVAAAGTTVEGINAATGIVGSLVDFDSSQTAALDLASWTAPDRSTGSVSYLSLALSGCGSGNPTFAGGPGHWEWSWKGASQQLGELAVVAWAPIGPYWRLFRTRGSGNPGVCLPGIGVPVARTPHSRGQ